MSESNQKKGFAVKGFAALIVFVAVLAAIIILGVTVDGYTFAGTLWSLVPPFVAIALALITKEVYSSLFAGIVLGAVMASGVTVNGSLDTLVEGFSTAVADNAGIFVFLVLLGIVVALINKAGASRAFGKWAETHIKTKLGAMIATIFLGILIFIDDYFNCLTVGSVMSPVTDSKKISRVKLAYIIDATAAPVCMIAPVSSWAAAVSGAVESETYSGIELFVRAIPYNFYSIYTLIFLFALAFMGFDYGKMSSFEIKAAKGDLSELATPAAKEEKTEEKEKDTHVFDLILPIAVLIVACIVGLMYVGGFFTAGDNRWNVISSFSDTDAYVGLPWGGFIALVIIIAYMLIRKLLNFAEAMECVCKGFIAMVPAITILTLATTLKFMTNDCLASADFVASIMEYVKNIEFLLPAVVFVVACIIAFATGTSWGTFGILIPIVSAVFAESSPLFFVGISACLAGAVCGDHCSPISDTTIMSSAGANCNHLDHVETQLPYAITVAAISFVNYLIAGLLSFANLQILSIPIGAVLTVAVLFVIKTMGKKKTAKAETVEADV